MRRRIGHIRPMVIYDPFLMASMGVGGCGRFEIRKGLY
jgi:hypothetical protein